ncbi:hypothetical protein [Microbacterium sp. SD291]|uniref:sensor histidine kinase n=1 Tax=Microbacterium sp. SD291 TaxID=2782007 RepID=UPI001A963DCA|nr:hypothetical protein [Microbacterium sp. SD291]MBO0982051.1 hypothetical protein [Microbacterium sp. SD291]
MIGASPSETEVSTSSDELRSVRLFTLGIGVVAAIAMIAMAAEVARPASLALPGVLLGLQFGLFLGASLAGALAALLSLRALRAVNGTLVVLHVLLLLTAWGLIVSVEVPLPGRQLSWMLIVVAIPVLSALLAWGAVGGWCTFAALIVLVAGLRLSVGSVTANSITNDIHTFSTAIVLCALGTGVLAAAREADAAAAEARRAGIRAAVASARHDVQMRAQLIVHDEVLAALGFAGRPSDAMLAPLAAQARRASEFVRDLSAVRPAGTDVAPRRLAEELRTLSIEHDARFAETGIPAFAPIPGPVVDALLGAAQQALVNRTAHAPGSRCAAELEWTEHALRVRIVDDGPGFDVAKASEQRMGVAISILTRMRSLPGGDASVLSEIGGGTEVHLDWRPVPVDDAPAPIADRPVPAEPLLRGGSLRAVAVVLMLGQVFLGGYDAVRTGDAHQAPLVTGTALVSLAVVTWWPRRHARLQTALLAVLGVAGLSTLTAWRGDATGPSYADFWPLTAHMLAIGLLCLRGRPGAAVLLAGIDLSATMLFLAPGPYGQLAAGLVRAVSIVLISVVLAVGIRRLRANAKRNLRRVLAATTAKAWQLAERDSSHANALRLQALVGGMLERIGQGSRLTAAEAAECRVLEGRLRDEYRGGRLAREPVISAVADARRRGVDVVLIDDVPEREVSDASLEAILHWLAEGARRAESSFLGRMLPVGRTVDVSAAIDEHATDFGG